MYIATASQTTMQNPLFTCFSERIQKLLSRVDVSKLEEIRLRRGKPLLLDFGQSQRFVTPDGTLCREEGDAYLVSEADIERSLTLACGGSVYACQEQIRHGFVTLAGGHRVGLVGRVVTEHGEVTSIQDISGLNFRFARQIFGAADRVIDAIIQNGTVRSTLIVSPPACGKTTLLRDIARQLSKRGYKAVIIDERSEIAAMTGGICGYDVGARTDVLDACPKAAGMMMAVRSMSPHVILTDEIGSAEDIEAIKAALRCGVSVVASIHASCAQTLFAQEGGQALCALFDTFVTLSKRCGSGTVEEVCSYQDLLRTVPGDGGVRKIC